MLLLFQRLRDSHTDRNPIGECSLSGFYNSIFGPSVHVIVQLYSSFIFTHLLTSPTSYQLLIYVLLAMSTSVLLVNSSESFLRFPAFSLFSLCLDVFPEHRSLLAKRLFCKFSYLLLSLYFCFFVLYCLEILQLCLRFVPILLLLSQSCHCLAE